MTSECGECGREFDSERSKNIHAGIAHRTEPRVVSCENCGSDVEKSPSELAEKNFCGNDCLTEWRTSRKETVVCDNCGSEHERSPSQINEGNNYCDQECLAEYRGENWDSNKNPNYEYNGVQCDSCGEEFHRKPSHVSDMNFCDWECKCQWQGDNISGERSNLWDGGPVEMPCDECGETITRKKSRVENSEKLFCSQECHGKWRSRVFSGQGNPRWKGGYTFYSGLLSQTCTDEPWEEKAERIREEYDRECQGCGRHTDELSRKLDIHHIVPLLSGGLHFDDNLLPFCTSCHKKAEGYINDKLELQGIYEYG